jgi:hypothetical protein
LLRERQERTDMEQVMISAALVLAIWCGGKLLVLARRDW